MVAQKTAAKISNVVNRSPSPKARKRLPLDGSLEISAEDNSPSHQKTKSDANLVAGHFERSSFRKSLDDLISQDFFESSLNKSSYNGNKECNSNGAASLMSSTFSIATTTAAATTPSVDCLYRETDDELENDRHDYLLRSESLCHFASSSYAFFVSNPYSSFLSTLSPEMFCLPLLIHRV